MNVRGAILASATLIESTPTLWTFYNSMVPAAGDHGCFIGFACAFLGFAPTCRIEAECYRVFGVSESQVYERMHSLCGNADWVRDPMTAVRTMRLYADTYHPAVAA